MCGDFAHRPLVAPEQMMKNGTFKPRLLARALRFDLALGPFGAAIGSPYTVYFSGRTTYY